MARLLFPQLDEQPYRPRERGSHRAERFVVHHTFTPFQAAWLTRSIPAGLSSSLNEQLKQVLDVVGTSLRTVNTTYRKNQKKKREQEQITQLRAAEDAKVRERIREGIWHDPRLDCVAGNGVMSELGMGDEKFGAMDADVPPVVAGTAAIDEYGLEHSPNGGNGDDANKKPRSEEDLQAIEAMPIVILRGFESKGGSARREELLTTLSQWAAGLAESQVRNCLLLSPFPSLSNIIRRLRMSSSSVTIARTPSSSHEVSFIISSQTHMPSSVTMI